MRKGGFAQPIREILAELKLAVRASTARRCDGPRFSLHTKHTTSPITADLSSPRDSALIPSYSEEPSSTNSLILVAASMLLRSFPRAAPRASATSTLSCIRKPTLAIRTYQSAAGPSSAIFQATQHPTQLPSSQQSRSAHAISNPTLAGIEKRWEGMPPQEQAELWMQLRDRMKVDWNELTLQEKKAGMSTSQIPREEGTSNAATGRVSTHLRNPNHLKIPGLSGFDTDVSPM